MRLRLTEKAPMLPVTAALAAGILLASWRMPPVWVAAAGVAACAAGAAVALRTGRAAATTAILLARVFLGAALTALQSRCDAAGDGYGVCEICIADDARPRADAATQQTDARLVAVREEAEGWRRVRGRLRVYADTSLRLTAGQHIVCRGRVRPFDGSDDGYGAMMRRKGYAGRLYLNSGSILQTGDERPPSLHRTLHRRAVARIAMLPLQPDDMTVAQAVGTGESSMLSRRLRSDYSRAGTAHLLALSGLHTGIVFLLINLLLKWLPLVAFGHIIRSCAAIVLLWLYVLATGMPPSAVRAALMFSMLQAARAASADYSALNALSAAAFVSLCFDTSLLFDAGFRLSYIAVAAILFCALPVIRRTRIRCRHDRNVAVKCCASSVNFITATIITGLAATVATAPLVSHLFGVIPLAGILTGPVAIAAAAATVMLTALWIVLPLDFAAGAFGRAVEFTVGAMNRLSAVTAAHDGAVIEIRLGSIEVAVCYLAVIVIVCALASIRDNRRQTSKFPIP